MHPYSAMNIDSVNINTSLIMMKECITSHGIALLASTRGLYLARHLSTLLTKEKLGNFNGDNRLFKSFLHVNYLTFFHHYQGSIDFNTVNIFIAL